MHIENNKVYKKYDINQNLNTLLFKYKILKFVPYVYQNYIVRDFVSGLTLKEFKFNDFNDYILYLDEIIQEQNRLVKMKMFHSDLNAGNIIIKNNYKINFIDPESILDVTNKDEPILSLIAHQLYSERLHPYINIIFDKYNIDKFDIIYFLEKQNKWHFWSINLYNRLAKI